MPTIINAAQQVKNPNLVPVKSPIARSSYDRIIGVEACLMRPFAHGYLKAALNSPEFRNSCYPAWHRAEPLTIAQNIEPAEGLIRQSGHYIEHKSPFSEFNFVLNLASLLPVFKDHEAEVQAFFDEGVPRALDTMSLTLSDDGPFWGIDPSTVRQTGLPSYQITESIKRTGPSLDLLFNRLSALMGKAVKTGEYEFTPWSFEMHLPIVPERRVKVNLYDIFEREDGGEVELASEGFVDARIAVYDQIRDGLWKTGFHMKNSRPI
ncbi:MAG: hypothetical protein WC490_03735 [Candidatus Margulisiibacteriota bacterium]